MMIDDASLVGFGVLVLRVSHCCPEGVCSLEMHLNSFPFPHFFEFFTCVRDVWNNYGGLGFGFVCCIVVGVVVGGLLDCCCD